MLKTLVIWLLTCVAGVSLGGCVGTDYIADAPNQSPSRIDVEPAMAAVAVGESLGLQAVYVDEAGQAVTDVTFTWLSSDPAVAEISEAGVLSGRSTGQVIVLASAAGVVSDSILIGVVANTQTQVATVRITPGAQALTPGDAISFTAESLNATGVSLPGQTYTWSSSDPLVVQIDAQGQASALTVGSVTVRAETSGITSNSARITVMGAARSGKFVGRDANHENRGTALLQPGTDGALMLTFSDDFFVTAGPGLEVFLSPGSTVGPGALGLGPIQHNQGTQAYPLSAGVALATHNWVIIHCVPFNITFGKAQLQ